MAVHKLHLDDLYDDDYDLIAIHSPLEDYRLAYFLNQRLPILLNKSKNSIEVTTKDGETFFSKFIFDDETNDMQWSLVQNKNEIIITNANTGQDLFLDTHFKMETSIFLIP